MSSTLPLSMLSNFLQPSLWTFPVVSIVPDCTLTHLPGRMDDQLSAQIDVQDVFSEVTPVNVQYTKFFPCKDTYEQKNCYFMLYLIIIRDLL